MRDLQPVDERECRDVFTAVEDFGQLALEAADVRFEAVTLPHLDGEKIRLMARCVFGEERFGYLLEVADNMWCRE